MTSQEKLEAFCTELVELCKKYDGRIAGCGCCESPWIEIVDENDKPLASRDNVRVSAKGIRTR